RVVMIWSMGETRWARLVCLKGKFMALKIFTVLALWLAMIASGWTAPVVDMQLIRAAFFSDACRQQAEALGVARTSDANALLAALAGLQRRPARSPTAGAQRDDCKVPAVALSTCYGSMGSMPSSFQRQWRRRRRRPIKPIASSFMSRSAIATSILRCR